MPSVAIDGPVGKLEARYQEPPTPTAPCALILHPNPQFGGSMNNLVVYTLYTAFVDAGFGALRFNYRGVGKSQGEFTADGSELDDAEAALGWFKARNPQAKAWWIGGFSYGAMIALRLLVKRKDFASFIAISPPATKYDFSFLDSSPAPGLFLHGGSDNLIPEAGTLDLVARMRGMGGQIDYARIEGASHFFDNQQEELGRVIAEFLKRAGQ